jgi:transposase
MSNRKWRGLDFGSILVEIVGDTQRIKCPEHGSIVADVPWAYPGSRFTKDFDLTVGWLAVYLPRSAVSEYMRIDWKTVGRCVSRTLHEIEPERNVRLNGLVCIGIDETSYKKGHKYITVVLNHETNAVVWAAPGHGKTVLEQFYRQLTPEQLASIKVVTGDGARWITDCINEFTPNCERCVDPFHVVEWAMDALDEVRREVWRKAYGEVKQLKKTAAPKRGRPKADDAQAQTVKQLQTKADDIKGSTYALGKAPENLTANQQLRLAMIQKENPRLYRAYLIKERLRLILKLQSVDEAAAELKHWLWWASHSRIPAMHELYQKVKRHKEHILNTIRLGFSNARIEAANNKIKLIIRKAYGFRNIDHLLDMVYLVCSDLTIPLPNRSLKP